MISTPLSPEFRSCGPTQSGPAADLQQGYM